ncbi:MAG TPA: 30S ribosomal protein S17 [Atribacteraceae bacterium]|nr:30S ribosomal protein S17 [Atribacteraceae bacterium]
MAVHKRLTGEVLSRQMDKTAVVRTFRIDEDLLYQKKLRRMKDYHAHDEANSCQAGDQVIIEEVRPLSKTKRWKVVEIVRKAQVEGGEEHDSTQDNA